LAADTSDGASRQERFLAQGLGLTPQRAKLVADLAFQIPEGAR